MVPPRCTPRVVVASRHDHHRPTDMTTPIELHPDMKKAELDRFLADAFGIKSNPFERPPAIAFFFYPFGRLYRPLLLRVLLRNPSLNETQEARQSPLFSTESADG